MELWNTQNPVILQHMILSEFLQRNNSCVGVFCFVCIFPFIMRIHLLYLFPVSVFPQPKILAHLLGSFHPIFVLDVISPNVNTWGAGSIILSHMVSDGARQLKIELQTAGRWYCPLPWFSYNLQKKAPLFTKIKVFKVAQYQLINW